MRLLDLETREWIGSRQNSEMADAIAYAPDGSQFVTVQPERIRLWDGRTGEYQASLGLPDLNGDPSIAYLPDSSGLLVADTDGSIWTANTRTDSWVAHACEIAGRNLSRAEWRLYFPTSTYRVTCPQWSAGT